MSDPCLSVVVVAYEMERELPRTVRSLSPAMQRGVDASAYEILVVDNGSAAPWDETRLPAYEANLRVLRVAHANASPARAVNLGIAAARGEVVGVLIDGARMASPGLLAGALHGARLHPRAVVASLGFHLGSEVQMRSIHAGYDQAAEDRVLAGLGWEDDGYRLFDAAVFAGSSAGGWFSPIAESNALFMARPLWAELGGLDERFVSPGGGLVNLDLYRRACELADIELVILLGEGTFHQVHGGVATNAPVSPWQGFHEEYVRLRGGPFAAPALEPWFVGRVRPPALASIAASAVSAEAATRSPLGARKGRHEPAERPESAEGQEQDERRASREQHESAERHRCGEQRERAERHELHADGCALSGSTLSAIQQGTLRTRYRGRIFWKSPFDVVILLQLVERLRPRTIIEIGTKEGGTALWLADLTRSLGLDTRILSVDLRESPAWQDERITFLRGDAADLGPTLPAALLAALRHPFLVLEDSAHLYETCLAVLEFFHPHLAEGDYVVIEDGVVRHLPEPQYRRYADGPLRAIAAFLAQHPGAYRIDRELCDYFGPNTTFNPDGYLCRVR